MKNLLNYIAGFFLERTYNFLDLIMMITLVAAIRSTLGFMGAWFVWIIISRLLTRWYYDLKPATANTNGSAR